MLVGIGRLRLLLPEAQSLKDKRAVLRRIKDKVRRRFNVAIAEVGENDLWQSGLLGFAVVGNERTFVEALVERITCFIADDTDGRIADDEREIIDYAEGALDSEGPPHWEPEEPSPMAGRRPIAKPRTAGPGRRRRPLLPVRGR